MLLRAGLVAMVCAILVVPACGMAWWIFGDELGSPSSESARSSVHQDAGGSAGDRSSAAPPEDGTTRVAECAGARPRGRVTREYWAMHVTAPVEGFPRAPIGAINL